MEEYSGADVYVCLESQVPRCVEKAKALSMGEKHVKRRREIAQGREEILVW
jgi:hypothetical protein